LDIGWEAADRPTIFPVMRAQLSIWPLKRAHGHDAASKFLLRRAMIQEGQPRVHIFDRLLERCRSFGPIRMAVAAPTTEIALSGALEAARRGLIEPILVGPSREIRALAERMGADLGTWTIVDASDDEDAAGKAVALCRGGQARGLMKGSLHSDTFMHAALQHESGLRTARRVSHAFLLDVAVYPRPLIVTDAAINICPSLDDKVDIVRNAIELAHAIGVERPNVAILSAVETVTSKIVSTIDAAALCKMADRGQITGALLDGPLAFDTAVSVAAAATKNLHSPVAGVADVLVVPDIESGNILVKELEYIGGAELAGVVLGASVPIVLTSRADSAQARVASCALALLSIARAR
jgi:phosphate acetyltransferase